MVTTSAVSLMIEVIALKFGFSYRLVFIHWNNKQTVRSCTMIMCLVTPSSHCSSFSWRTEFLTSPRYCILQILLYATFGSSWDSKFGCQVTILHPQKKFNSVTAGLTAVPKEGVLRCFEQWCDHWIKYVCRRAVYCGYTFCYWWCMTSMNSFILPHILCTYRPIFVL